MGRRRRGFRSLKAAKIWVILLLVAVIYTIRVKTGASEKSDFLSDLNSFGENWLTVAWWIFGAAAVLFLYSKIGRGRPKRNGSGNRRRDDYGDEELTELDSDDLD